MTDLLYNVFLPPYLTSQKEWQIEASRWQKLGQDVGVNPDFNPLTVKALYVTGTILNCCKSVSILLDEQHLISTTFYPAYMIFASAIELLGRCIRGNASIRNLSVDLMTGFQWLATRDFGQYSLVKKGDAVFKTDNYAYSINDLVALRHFCAHGQASNQSSDKDFDYLILGVVPHILGDSIQGYLVELLSREELANHLAVARVTPYRNRPIFDSLWGSNANANSFPSSLGDAIRKMEWNYKDPLSKALGGMSASLD